MSAGTRLFVYGTLLRGQENAARLSPAAFVGRAATVAAYTLVDLGPYPALRAGGATVVHGELYAVDAATLAALDDFEGHPTLFCRGPIALAGGHGAEAYLLPTGAAATALARIIPGGDWRRHRGRR